MMSGKYLDKYFRAPARKLGKQLGARGLPPIPQSRGYLDKTGPDRGARSLAEAV